MKIIPFLNLKTTKLFLDMDIVKQKNIKDLPEIPEDTVETVVFPSWQYDWAVQTDLSGTSFAEDAVSL